MKSKPTRRPTQIRLANHIRLRLTSIARKRGTTVTALIQDAIADWLIEYAKKERQ
jgi:predicted transcriptional regulator